MSGNKITQENNEADNEENPPKRKSARLAGLATSLAAEGTLSLEKPKSKQWPFVVYSGTIKYFTEQGEIAEVADLVMQWVDKQTEDIVPMAFDLEWPFSFQTGPGKTSVMQICVEETCCYIFHLSNLKKIPAALMALLRHPKVLLHGVNIKADFRKMARDFSEVNADELIGKCIDLGVWCNEVCETGGRWSLDRLAKYISKKAVDKNKKVRMSKWHIIPLNENQLMYAAIDVYIGQLIYRELERRAKNKEQQIKEFKEKNGEAAYNAVKALGETFLNETNDVTSDE